MTTMSLPVFAKLPVKPITEDQHVLRRFRATPHALADNIAALLVYCVLVQHANPDFSYRSPTPGQVRLTIADLREIIGVSRQKILRGIQRLEDQGLVYTQRNAGRTANVYQVLGYGEIPWAKFPGRSLYNSGATHIPVFHRFTLRNRTELHALKVYLYLVARRDRQPNLTRASYGQIERATAVSRNHIRAAISFLVNQELVDVIYLANDDPQSYSQVHNAYRIRGIEPRRHMGTTGRGTEEVT